MHEHFDLLIVGAGLDGLLASARARRTGSSTLLVDRSPTPGGAVRTLRSEGFVCELGPFALARAEWNEHADLLSATPPAQALLDAARTGFVWNGRELAPAPVEGDPVSGPSGLEDLVVAHRRDAQSATATGLRLGRAVTAIEPGPNGFTATLGGEVEAHVTARALALHLPVDEQARLCGRFDPALPDVAARLRRIPVAACFLGWFDGAATVPLRGYGLLVEDGGASGAREAIFCTNAFARRAQAGKSLVRVELEGATANGDDAAVLAAARALLASAIGLEADPIFARVHRRTELLPDGAFAECRVRLQAIARQVDGLVLGD